MNTSLFRKRRRVSGGVIPPFSPLSIANCVLWLDGADGATLIGNPVGTWVDKSPTGADFEVNGADALPSVGTWPLNANSCVVFAGAESLTAGNVPALEFTNDGTIITVFNSTETVNDEMENVIYKNSAWIVAPYLDTGNFQLYISDFQGNGIDETVPQAPMYVASLIDSNVLDVYLDGVLLVSGAVLTPLVTGGVVSIGNCDFPAYLNGEIAEIICYSRAITPVELSDLNTYLSTKWGL